MSAPQSWIWSLRPTLDLNTDNFQSQVTKSTAPYSLILNIGLVAAWHIACVLYVTCTEKRDHSGYFIKIEFLARNDSSVCARAESNGASFVKKY